MSNKEILEKAISKAIDGGWDRPNDFYFAGNRVYFVMSELSEEVLTYNDIIFNHDFAKALWPGEDNVYAAEVYRSPVKGDAGFDEYLTLSEYHLQNMVIAEDPIAYLGKNI